MIYEMADEVETAMYVHDPAWHYKGKLLHEEPDVPTAMQESETNWEVEDVPIYIPCMVPDHINVSGNYVPGYQEVKTGHRAIVRMTDRKVLGVVGSRHQTLQNWKAFEPFIPLVEAGLVKLDAAGSLRGGQRVWMLAKICDMGTEIVKGDPIQSYLLCYNSHDGSLCASYQQTVVRVVCANTLALAMHNAETGKELRLKLRHTRSITDQVDKLKAEFSVAAQTFKQTATMYRFLAGEKCHDRMRYFRKVLEIPEEKPERGPSERAGIYGVLSRVKKEAEKPGERQLGRLMEIHENQPGVEFARGSKWHAYNSVTYWLEHDRGSDDESRLNQSWFGEGATLRRRALDVALKN